MTDQDSKVSLRLLVLPNALEVQNCIWQPTNKNDMRSLRIYNFQQHSNDKRNLNRWVHKQLTPVGTILGSKCNIVFPIQRNQQ